MKLPFKITAIKLILVAVILYAALPALNVTGTSEKEQQAETDRCLLDALRENNRDPVAHYLRALLHMKMGDLAVARTELDAAKAIDPTGDFAGHEGVGKGAIAMVEHDIASAALPNSRKPSPLLALVTGGIFVNVLFVGGLVSWRRRTRAKASNLAATS